MKNAEGAPNADDARRDRIIKAASGLFMTRGYAGVSTRDLATAAKVSKRELYALFENKQAILVACITGRIARINTPVSLPVATDRTTLTSVLTEFGAATLRELTQPQVTALFRLAIVESTHAPEIAQSLDSAGRSPLRAALLEFLAGARGRQLLGAADPEAMTAHYFALLFGELRFRLVMGLDQPPSEADIDRRARATTEAFLRLHAS